MSTRSRLFSNLSKIAPVSIGRKLVLLLLLSIVLVLALVGVSLDFIVREYHENRAQGEFSRAFRHAVMELEEREGNLIAAVNGIAENERLISTLSMIHRYARPKAYDASLFDLEKENIAGMVRNQVHARDLGRMAVYDGRGALTAFYFKGDEPVSGIISYDKKGRSVVLTQIEDAPWQPGKLPEELPRFQSISKTPPPRLYRSGDEMAIEVTRQVVRSFPNKRSQQIGQVRGVEFLGDDFVAAVTARSDVQFALIFDDGRVIGKIEGIKVRDLAPVKMLDRAKPELHTKIAHPDYFLAATKLGLDRRKGVYLIAGVEKASVFAQVARSQELLLLVLVLSALIIIPTGALAAKRVISERVDLLLEGAEALSRGELARRVSVAGSDELGSLARSFNSMADALERRQNALAESEARYRTLMDRLPLSVFYKDRNFIYRSCNLHFAEDRGLRPEQVIGKNDYDLYPEELADRYRNGDHALLSLEQVLEFDEPNLQRGELHLVHTTMTPVWDVAGRVVGILGIYYDITESKKAEEQLRQAAAVFESTAEGVLITDSNRVIIAVNKAFTRITGYSAEEVIGCSPALLRPDNQGDEFLEAVWHEVELLGSWQGEIWNQRKNGEIHPEWMAVSVVRDDAEQIINYVGVFSDITAIKRSQDQLDYLAHHDPVTDLPNRLLFAGRLAHAMERTRGSDGQVAVLFLDLDRFKYVNDTLGHPVGDALLQRVAERLKQCLRVGDTVARMGGDEFVVTVEQTGGRAQLSAIAQKLIDSFAQPFVVEGKELHLGVSIGISMFPQDGEDVATLVKNADAAMYLAKEEGRNTYRFFTTALGIEAEERFQMEGELRHAHERDELELFFQPQVELKTGRVTGAEALVRWRHRKLGLVTPDRFIALAEETGFIVPIGEWVLRTACLQLVAWRKKGYSLNRISVNLSGKQIERSDLVSIVSTILEETGIPPSSLELEVTESVIMKDPAQAAVILDGLRGLGVELAIDDFGTGYSSLSYLKRFPLDNLKIDRSFVSGVPQDTNDVAIIRAVVALADNLQLRVTAEGVETEGQRAFLLAQGCVAAQGYLFGPAVPKTKFESLLKPKAKKKPSTGTKQPRLARRS